MKKQPLTIRIRHLALLMAASILGDAIVVALGLQPWTVVEYGVKNTVIVFIVAVLWSLASKYGLLSPKGAIRQPSPSLDKDGLPHDPRTDPIKEAIKHPPGWDIDKLIEHDSSVTIVQREDPAPHTKPPPGYQ